MEKPTKNGRKWPTKDCEKYNRTMKNLLLRKNGKFFKLKVSHRNQTKKSRL